jgi:UDP-2,3-diacylglucosamine pyrophosphatase LpxH
MEAYIKRLEELYEKSPRIKLKSKDKYLFISDFHIAARGVRDDFAPNSRMIMSLLKEYYYPQNYILVLNGDIEELQKVKPKVIVKKWKDLYAIFDLFRSDNRLYKLIGNHDMALLKSKNLAAVNSTLLESFILESSFGDLFIFHGHQASKYNGFNYHLSSFFLRYLVKPLGIKNIVREYSSKTHKVEERVYEFSRKNKLVSVIGHTHRPVFESLSDIDIAVFTIENLSREYMGASKRKKESIKKEVHQLKIDLKRMLEDTSMQSSIGSIYNKELSIPTFFNSGCVIGKKMAHCLELSNDTISLVRWNSKKQKEKYFDEDTAKEIQLSKGSCYKKILKQDTLEYIFNRIHLLGDSGSEEPEK